MNIVSMLYHVVCDSSCKQCHNQLASQCKPKLSCRCRLELTVEMLKMKQAPAEGLTPPAAADIETGIPISTDNSADQVDPPLDQAPTVVVIPAEQEYDRRGTPADCQLTSEEAQHSRAPRIAVLGDTTSQPPV